MPKPNCLDCQKLLPDYRSKRCKQCSFKSIEYKEKMRRLAIKNGNKPPQYDATGKHWKNSPEANIAKSILVKSEYASGKRKSFFKKGERQSPESIEKRRLKVLGQKRSLETRRRISESHKGAKSHFWQGGRTEKTRLFRERMDYKLWREAVFKRDDYTCQMCHTRGGKLTAHHIKSFAKFPELRIVLENGQTLCHLCHKKTESYGVNEWYNRIRNDRGQFRGIKKH